MIFNSCLFFNQKYTISSRKYTFNAIYAPRKFCFVQTNWRFIQRLKIYRPNCSKPTFSRLSNKIHRKLHFETCIIVIQRPCSMIAYIELFRIFRSILYLWKVYFWNSEEKKYFTSKWKLISCGKKWILYEKNKQQRKKLNASSKGYSSHQWSYQLK